MLILAPMGRRGVPKSSRVARRLEGLRTHAERQGQAGRRRAPWEQGASSGRGVLPPPNTCPEGGCQGVFTIFRPPSQDGGAAMSHDE